MPPPAFQLRKAAAGFHDANHKEQNQKRIRDCLQRVVDPDNHIPDPAAFEIFRAGGQQRPDLRQFAVPRFQRGIEIIYDPVST